MSEDPFDELNQQGRELLAELAVDVDSECWRQFDALFYEPVWKYLRGRHELLAARVARHLGIEGVVAPSLQVTEIDEVAHEATIVALRRVREGAGRFDPARGTPIQWVFGSAEFAFTEVAKTIVGARRPDNLDFVSPDTLVDVADTQHPTTEEHVIRSVSDVEALESASAAVSEKEWTALRLVVGLGYSYAEAAQEMFGDAGMSKQVDGLLSRGKKKLARAWVDRRSAPRSSSSPNVSTASDDMEEDNE